MSMHPFLLRINQLIYLPMKSIFYLLTAAIVASTALVIYGVVTDDIRNFCFGITGLVMSVPAAVLLADELDKRRV